jgi:RNA polymerase sigma factor (sigma-70 family)
LARFYEERKKVLANERTDIDLDTVAARTEGHDTRLDVVTALDTLDEHTREIVVLHHFSGYSFVEIAPIMRMTESAVRVRHHRALKSLHDTLTRI